MIGPAFTYDTTDSHTQPAAGVEIDASWTFGLDVLGNSFDHDKLMAEGHAYFSLSERTGAGDERAVLQRRRRRPVLQLVPLRRLGRPARLRDRPLPRPGELGGAGRGAAPLQPSGGAGWSSPVSAAIAPSAGDLIDESNLLPAGGVGVRYRPFKNNDVQLRVDVAVGKNDHGIYVGIGEAF